MVQDLQQAYEHCRLVTKGNAKNFYYAFLTLPSAKRRAIYASYAFCRLCDDIADEDIPTERKMEMFADTRLRLEQLSDGQDEDPVFSALYDTAAIYDIPLQYFHEVLDGVEMDMTWSRFESFEELSKYCYKVASVVGLICIEIFGYKDPRARDYAVDLGLAMQLTNIIRDVKEDAERDRIYIPLDEIDSFGYSEEDLIDGTVNDSFLRLMQFQADRARRYFESGKRLLPLLSGSSRACPAVLHAIYSALLDRIEDRGFRVFDGRMSLSTREKLFIMTRTWARNMLPLPAPSP